MNQMSIRNIEDLFVRKSSKMEKVHTGFDRIFKKKTGFESSLKDEEDYLHQYRKTCDGLDGLWPT